MANEFPLQPAELKKYNIRKYKGIPPDWELIRKVIKRSGLKFQSHFELVWGISHKILTQVKRGDKVLPCRYWHIFYDFDNIKKVTKKRIEEKKEVARKKVNVLVTNKQLLDELKAGGTE